MSQDDLDNDLIQAARDGHDYASAFLVSRYGSEVLGYCRAIASDLSDVDREHIVENAIETAVRKIDRFDPARGKFGSWIRTFVLNSVRDWRRSHARLDSLDDEDRRIPEPASDAFGVPLSGSSADTDRSTIHDSHAQERLTPAYQAVLEVLPTMRVNDQIVIAMRDIEGRTTEEAAASLKITPAACRQRHHRAKKRLKAMLRDDPRCVFLFPGEPA